MNSKNKEMPKEYTHAPEIERIAEKLIEMFKPELEGFEIRYIFSSENPKKDGAEKTALARKITGLNAYLAGCPEGFFLIEFGRPAFDSLDENTLIAVVYHEILHFGVSDDGNLAILPHDIENFSSEVKIFGAYTTDLQIFHEALNIGEQSTDSRDEIINRILEK